jgi:hypothetical protein
VPAADFLGLSPDDWDVIIQIVSAVAVVTGVVFGLVQLRGLATQARFASTVRFQEILQEHSDLFNRIVDRFPVDASPADLDELDDDLRDDARRAVNAQNIIGQLVEEGLVDCRSYFSLTHVQIVRLSYLLRPYTEWEQARQGAPYGRRIHRIASRARRFHQLSPQYRRTPITITRPSQHVVVVAADSTTRSHPQRVGCWLEYTYRRRLDRF